MMNIGERIKELRAKKGYSQEQFAELANLNRVTIAKYEAGKIEPGAQALSRMADAFEISVDELLGRNLQEMKNMDSDTMAIRERLRRDPTYRILFDASARVRPEHLEAAAAMLQALGPNDD